MLFTVYEMERLGRDAAALTALADRLAAQPSGPGRMFFGRRRRATRIG
jgi:hypothetical protein